MVAVPVSSVDVGARHRRDLGNVGSLAASIAEIGLLHPIVVTSSHRLIAGERRLAAFKALGRAEIAATVIDIEALARGERDENTERKDFTPSESVAVADAVVEEEARLARKRQGERTDKHPGKFPESGQSRDRAAAGTGRSGRTIEKAREVVEAAEEDPERFGSLVEEMDRTGKVGGAHRKLRMARDEKRIMSLEAVEGKHRTLVVDPPWDYEWLSLAGRAAPGYATMSHEELLALDVARWADDGCHLYLWTTNNFMTRAVELMARWGFQHKTVLTWVKPRWGLGSYFRNSTEHVLFGVRGELRTRVDNIATHFEAAVGEHSEKPEEFYDIVRRASYPAYGECFQRTARDDFHNLFKQQEVA